MPRDEAHLSADALRMREAIEQRLFAPAPRLVRPRRRRWRLGGVHERDQRPRGHWVVAIAIVIAAVLVALALRL